MPVPKRAHSKGRTARKRNSHFFRTIVETMNCKDCGSLKLPHRECKNCGNK